MKILYINWIDFLDDVLYNTWFKLWFQLLDNSLSCLILTSQEKQDSQHLFFLKKFFTFLFWLLLTILTTPIGLLTYCVWFILFRKLFRQRPFRLSVAPKKKSLLISENSSLNSYTHDVNKLFQVLSINVCLLPETISRINNLSLSHRRLESIGSLLNRTKSSNNLSNNNNTTLNTTTTTINNNNNSNYGKTQLSNGNDSNHNNDNNLEKDRKIKIIHDFVEKTDIDFLCMQEVWSIDTAKKLKNMLHDTFDYILYDAGTNTFKSNKFIGFDSGLLIASKFPIVDANFSSFSVRVGSCSLTSKGLLTAKVFLGKYINGKDAVGYISNTHLQAYPSIIFCQAL
jgi:sphingomyelin phosphodiesterase 3